MPTLYNILVPDESKIFLEIPGFDTFEAILLSNITIGAQASYTKPETDIMKMGIEASKTLNAIANLGSGVAQGNTQAIMEQMLKSIAFSRSRAVFAPSQYLTYQ